MSRASEPMSKCEGCGADGAYPGFNFPECVNEECRYFSPELFEEHVDAEVNRGATQPGRFRVYRAPAVEPSSPEQCSTSYEEPPGNEGGHG